MEQSHIINYLNDLIYENILNRIEKKIQIKWNSKLIKWI